MAVVGAGGAVVILFVFVVLFAMLVLPFGVRSGAGVRGGGCGFLPCEGAGLRCLPPWLHV
jgi:hypothetical protein